MLKQQNRKSVVWSYLLGSAFIFLLILVGNPARVEGYIASVCTPPPSDMVSWWGGDNNALDMVGGNNGSLLNGATYAPGKVGQAFRFNSPGDYVSVPDSSSLDITGQITLDAWIYPTALGGRIVDKITAGRTDGYLLDTYGGVVRLIVGNQGLSGTTALTPNTWTHVAGTYNGTTMTVYVNGLPDGSRATSIAIPANSLPLRIGIASDGSSSFAGSIDEVEVFGRALSESEIAALFYADSAGKCRLCTPPPSSMVAWWDAEGDASDIIGTNHGTLQNGTTFAAGKVGQAFSFDGADDYVTVPDSPQFNIGAGDFSLSLWANYSAVRSGAKDNLPNVFLGQDDGGGTNNKWVFYSTDSGLWFHINGPSLSFVGPAVFTPQTGRWYQFTLTRTGSVYAFYVDGLKIGEVTDSTTIPNVNTPLMIAQAEGLGYFNGLMDEITVLNRALSASEIAAIYNAGSAGKCNQQQEQFALTVTKTGTGAGTVTATGISCGTDCSEAYDPGTVVALTATPSAGSIFAGWSGDPDCLDGSVTMNTDKACSAIFKLAPDLIGSWSSIRKSGPDRRGIYKLSGSLNVSNTGVVPANNVALNVYLSDNDSYEPGDTLIASLYYGTIGGKISRGKLFTVSTKTNPKGKYVIGVIDPSNFVIESNESNNSASRLVP